MFLGHGNSYCGGRRTFGVRMHWKPSFLRQHYSILHPLQTILQNSLISLKPMCPFIVPQSIPYNFCLWMFYDPDRRIFLTRFEAFAHGKHLDFGSWIFFPTVELVNDPEGFRYALHDGMVRFYYGDLKFLKVFVRP